MDEGWWRGSCRGKNGLFPANYVEIQQWNPGTKFLLESSKCTDSSFSYKPRTEIKGSSHGITIICNDITIFKEIVIHFFFNKCLIAFSMNLKNVWNPVFLWMCLINGYIHSYLFYVGITFLMTMYTNSFWIKILYMCMYFVKHFEVNNNFLI